jgi:hypothetical protein
VRLAGVHLEECTSCKGLWLDAGEALAIARTLGIGPGTPGAAGITCGICGRQGLRLDQTMCTEDGIVCETCGRGVEERFKVAHPFDPRAAPGGPLAADSAEPSTQRRVALCFYAGTGLLLLLARIMLALAR